MILHGLGVALGLVGVVLILWDGFDYALIPGKPTRYARPSRLLVHRLWWYTKQAVRWVPSLERREALFGWFGPLSLLATFVFWAVGLVLAFGLVQWGMESRLHDAFSFPGLFDYLYFSGATFFTLGYGDIVPLSVAGRLISILEVGTGFSFLALMISYLPVLSQAYAAREVEVVKLAVRADTPPPPARSWRARGRQTGSAR
jgi:Ion channel